ncbi:hypothetical protein JD844_032869 [Phrynosoma platyrhinos]|uniref:Ig-like domain-containing protein n=1 Tax=Phrynosoma platyrhinos TaxID=52577 RepID=A0ABQ7T5J2_PHRPL|nr:hypothetical protein JD844_032869 [Phrynosoma platyrhinos]
MDCCSDCHERMCLRKGLLEIKNLTENDEGKYTLGSENHSETLLLRLCELPLVVHINCLSDGRADLSCEAGGQSNDSIHWTLNGSRMNDVDACQKDGGKRIILEKGVHGKLVCHRRNSCSSSSIELSCNEGNDEDEKDEGITLAAISSEGQKSPPNREDCEATSALDDSTVNPGPETGESFKPELNPTIEAEVESERKTEEKSGTETEFREVMVDSATLEAVDVHFSDPTDA